MTQLLDIATVVERDTVNIRSTRHPAGKVYELVNLDELGVFEHETILARSAAASKYTQLRRKPTAADKRDLMKALGDVLVLIVLGLEPSVLAEIEAPQRDKIIGAWAEKYSGEAAGEAPAALTTGGSSPGSKRSTAASRKRGSTSQRGR